MLQCSFPEADLDKAVSRTNFNGLFGSRFDYIANGNPAIKTHIRHLLAALCTDSAQTGENICNSAPYLSVETFFCETP